MNRTLVFLDFDGVICNSVYECLYSATVSYYVKLLKREIHSIPLAFKERFLHTRPYIRTGEDYIVLAEIADTGVTIDSQESFDTKLSSYTPKQLSQFRDLFYKTRRELLENDFEHWMRLNPLYKSTEELLKGLVLDPNVFILSTKAKDLILKILNYHGILWSEEKVLFSGKESKKEIMGSILDSRGLDRAVFLDDQLDHLKAAQEDARVSPFLAGWGYVKPEWLTQKTIPVLKLEDLYQGKEFLIHRCV